MVSSLGLLLLCAHCASRSEPAAKSTVTIEIPKAKGEQSKPPEAATTGAESTPPPPRDISREEAEREEVRKASELIATLRPRFNHCFWSHVSGLQKRRVVLEFEIQRDGSTKKLELEPKFRNAALTACLRKALDSVKFDPPSLDVAKVRVPLKLRVP